MDRTTYRLQHETANIYPLGDVHLGSPACAWGAFKGAVRAAVRDPRAVVILMGDLFDAVLPGDKRFNADEPALALDRHYVSMRDALMPLKGRIAGVIEGNHEHKLTKLGVGSPVRRLAEDLGAPFLGFSGFVRILPCAKSDRGKWVHPAILDIYAHHGFVAGRKRGGKVNALEDFSLNFDADLYLMGHCHDAFDTKRVVVGFGGARQRYFCSTGTFHKTAEWGTMSYSEAKGYPIQALGAPRIRWEPNTRQRMDGDCRLNGRLKVY